MIYSESVLTEFEEKYAADLILCCFGDEAAVYAKDFSLNEAHIIKYNHNIKRNLDYINNKHVVDIGSNTGTWAVLMSLSGAKKVTCIEPRKQLCNGINKFAKMHNLPINCVNGFHRNVFDIEEKIDTVSMMNVDDTVDEMIYFLNSLRKVSDYFLLKTKNCDDFVGENEIKFEFKHNLYHRGGFSINAQLNELNDFCYETSTEDFLNQPNLGRHIRYYYGKNFYDNIFDYLGYTVLDKLIVDQIDNDEPYKCYSVKLNHK